MVFSIIEFAAQFVACVANFSKDKFSAPSRKVDSAESQLSRRFSLRASARCQKLTSDQQ